MCKKSTKACRLGKAEDRNRFFPLHTQGEAHLAFPYLGRPSAMGTHYSERLWTLSSFSADPVPVLVHLLQWLKEGLGWEWLFCNQVNFHYGSCRQSESKVQLRVPKTLRLSLSTRSVCRVTALKPLLRALQRREICHTFFACLSGPYSKRLHVLASALCSTSQNTALLRVGHVSWAACS